MIRTKCSNCGNVRYIQDNDNTFTSCPECGNVFTDVDRKSWKKIRDLTTDDTPEISHILFIIIISIAAIGGIFSIILGMSTAIGYGSGFNWIVFIASLCFYGNIVLFLFILKTIIDTLHQNKLETQRIREFMEYIVEQQTKKEGEK